MRRHGLERCVRRSKRALQRLSKTGLCFIVTEFLRRLLLFCSLSPCETKPVERSGNPMTTFLFRIGGVDPELYSTTDGVKRPDRNIPLDEVITLADQDPIWENRGKAIQGYAQLEHALCSLLAHLSDVPQTVASTIFYKIGNTGSRNSILQKLLHKKHGSTFNLFWNAYLKELRIIDIKRNEIVHWLAAANAAFNTDEMLIVGVTLIPPDSAAGPDTPNITSKDLVAFQSKCDEFSRLVVMFLGAVNPPPGMDPASTKSWLEIYRRPLIYPLPAGHPLSQKPKAPEPPLHPASRR